MQREKKLHYRMIKKITEGRNSFLEVEWRLQNQISFCININNNNKRLKITEIIHGRIYFSHCVQFNAYFSSSQ